MITSFTNWLVSQKSTKLQDAGWFLTGVHTRVYHFFHPLSEAQKARNMAILLSGREDLTEDEVKQILQQYA